MIHDHKELKPFKRLIKLSMESKAECTPAIQNLMSQRSKTTRMVRTANREVHAYCAKRQYLEDAVKEHPRPYPVWYPWMKEEDIRTALKLLRKAEEVCGRQVISNTLQFILELREVEKIAQSYHDIFVDLNHMCDWTNRVTSKLNVVKDTLNDPWCHLTAEMVLPKDNDLRTFRKPTTLNARSESSSQGWRSDIVYDPWRPKYDPEKRRKPLKVWPNSRLKVVRTPEIQSDNCQSQEVPVKVQPESCESSDLSMTTSQTGSSCSSTTDNIQNE